ncbi:hypothetical protein Bca101_058284 [Brassica carinata]
MENHPFRSIPRARTPSVPNPSVDDADISSFSSEHNQSMERPSYHYGGAAVGHNIYSNDHHNHPSHSDTPFISEMLDWYPASIPDFFDFPLDVHIQSNQLEEEDGGIVASDDTIHTQSDLAKCDEELLTDDENPLMSTLFNHLFHDTSSISAASKVQEPTMNSQIQQPHLVLHQTSPIVRIVSSNSNNNSFISNNNTAAAKGRLRWTPELHEAFVEAVNLLGGMESSPETKLTPREHATSLDTKSGMYITEALRIQMEVQKQLHEQLEIQRKMQRQIEKQGKALLMMIEKQNLDFGKPEKEDSAEEADSRRSKRPRNNE